MLGHVIWLAFWSSAEAELSALAPFIGGWRSLEFCEEEVFAATCPSSEVVLVSRAEYGRMKFSRCVQIDLGTLGCSVDVTTLLRSRCSTLPTCELKVFELKRHEGDDSPCLRETSRYLYVNYTCLSVVRPSCDGDPFGRPPLPSGVFSSGLPSSCDATTRPWLLEAGPSRRFNLTLWSFNNRVDTSIVTDCVEIALIREGDHQQRICASPVPVSHAYTSSGNTLLLSVNRAWSAASARYLVSYEEIGCDEVELDARRMWVKYSADTALIGCAQSDVTSTYHCRDHRWMGKPPECQEASGSTESVRFFFVKILDSFPNGVVIALIISIAILISLCILVAGLVCLRRRQDALDRSTYQPADLQLPVDRGPPAQKLATSDRLPASACGARPADKNLATQSRFDRSTRTSQPPSGEHIYESPVFGRRQLPVYLELDTEALTH